MYLPIPKNQDIHIILRFLTNHAFSRSTVYFCLYTGQYNVIINGESPTLHRTSLWFSSIEKRNFGTRIITAHYNVMHNYYGVKRELGGCQCQMCELRARRVCCSYTIRAACQLLLGLQVTVVRGNRFYNNAVENGRRLNLITVLIAYNIYFVHIFIVKLYRSGMNITRPRSHLTV